MLENQRRFRLNFRPEKMSTPPEIRVPEKSLSDEDLRALARRHGLIFRRFRARIERENFQREQRELIYSTARQVAAEMSARSRATSAPAPRHDPAPAENSSGKRDDFSEEKSATNSVSHAENFRHGKHFAPPPPESAVTKFFKKIGGGSLSLSLALHTLLIVFAFFWVVAVHVAPEEKPPTFFATGAGGGRGGERPSYDDVQSQRRSAGKIRAGANIHKIVSNKTKPSLTLPDVATPLPLAETLSTGLSVASAAGRLGGVLSSGSGGGLGGGVGRGIGTGIGNGRNFVSKFQTTQKILGTNVTAEKLAVYFDVSPSMTEVVPVVEKEILKKFPKADVFRVFGCGMSNQSVRVLPSEKSWLAEKARLLKKFDSEKKSIPRSALKKTVRKKSRDNFPGGFFEEDQTWVEALSSYGKALVERWSLASGGNDLGRWLSMTISEGGYDAIFVFADFQDYHDGEISQESELLERWATQARANGQRVYFFTTEMFPSKIFRALAQYTGGDIAIPKETAKASATARRTKDEIKAWERTVKKASRNSVAIPVSEEKIDDEKISGTDDDFSSEEFDEETDAGTDGNASGGAFGENFL